MTHPTSVCRLGGLFAALVCSSAAQAQFTFDNGADFAASFVQTGPGAGSMSVTNATGIGGVPGVLLPTTTNQDTTAIFNTPFDWTAAPSASLSAFFQYRGVDGSSTRQYTQVGLLESNTASFNTSTGADYVSVRAQNSGGAELSLLGQVGVNGVATNVGQIFFPIAGNIVTNNWYRLLGTFTRLGSNQIGFNVALTDFGSDGLTAGSTIASTSGTFTVAAGFYTDTAVFSGLRSTINSGQGYIDNFSPVPEPAAAAAVIGLFGLGLVLWRRRRS